ncbi:hypothetical protein GTP38_04595 [Duganella sp. FT94W]|uniref:Choline dehydrogenase n=1 Tax=Duganella lactea TaxID=2692173 RepID=A0ABW9V4F9_9BURK|nr:TorF family putative porin [Duganella lactea]MYM33615.1 hypothetical protein [Duganella lactea]
MTLTRTRVRTLTLLTLAAVSGGAFAADPAPAWTDTGNVTVVSDYLFRGISQTQAKPTAQANLDFTHASGWYVGLFGSGVSHAAYNNGGGAEIDVYGGYRAPMGADSTLDAGVVTYWFPGAHYPAGGKDIKYHSQDAKLAWNTGAFNVTGWVTLSKYWFGFTTDPFSGLQVDTRGSLYGEVNWNPELAPGLTLNLHAGRQSVRNLGMYNFYDVKAGVTKTAGNWAFSAAAVYNSGKQERDGTPLWTFYNADGSGKYVAQKRLLLSVTRNF